VAGPSLVTQILAGIAERPLTLWHHTLTLSPCQLFPKTVTYVENHLVGNCLLGILYLTQKALAWPMVLDLAGEGRLRVRQDGPSLAFEVVYEPERELGEMKVAGLPVLAQGKVIPMTRGVGAPGASPG
jgi:hypothetical protein